jgi:hypothetical protein
MTVKGNKRLRPHIKTRPGILGDPITRDGSLEGRRIGMVAKYFLGGYLP